MPGLPIYRANRRLWLQPISSVKGRIMSGFGLFAITLSHTERCSTFALSLAEQLGLDDEQTSIVRLSSLLHDVGKIAVPDQVLSKPGPLNEKEWAQMKAHPTAALHVLGQIRSLSEAAPAILHHHEHFDGSGYPDGLKGDSIPIASRILLVTDAFDAMTSDRPYRKAMPVEHAIEELKRNSGTQFDPDVVEAFLKILSTEAGKASVHSHERSERSGSVSHA
jgi:HD-GYP domain-containing protein (c-di-GMP phosphodiesterase class II)